jgi:hypothetical protein
MHHEFSTRFANSRTISDCHQARPVQRIPRQGRPLAIASSAVLGNYERAGGDRSEAANPRELGPA